MRPLRPARAGLATGMAAALCHHCHRCAAWCHWEGTEQSTASNHGQQTKTALGHKDSRKRGQG